MDAPTIMMRMFLAGVAVFSASFSSFANTLQVGPKPLAEMDFEMVNGRIYVPGTVNGHRTSIIIDSGAEVCAVDLALAGRWHFTTIGKVTADGSGANKAQGKALVGVSANIGGISVPVVFCLWRVSVKVFVKDIVRNGWADPFQAVAQSNGLRRWVDRKVSRRVWFSSWPLPRF